MRNGDGTFGKGNKGKPKGARSNKSKQWEQLGLMHQEGGAEIAKKVIEKLGERCFDENNNIDEKAALVFMEVYNKTLEYFKPKKARVENVQEGEQVIRVVRE